MSWKIIFAKPSIESTVAINRAIDELRPYPFERLRALKATLQPPPDKHHIALSLGEPKHAAPDFVIKALTDPALMRASLGSYPATRGSEELRAAMAQWLSNRFHTHVDPETQVLPAAGTREALFALAQALLSGTPGARVMMPNPFYQIYEGAALMRGAEPAFLSADPDRGYLPNFDTVPEALWRSVELVYLCTPGNPTGAVSSTRQLQQLLELAERHDFIVASDECYSEIYNDEATPPPGLLSAAEQMGNTEYKRVLVLNSLSKRSNLPGLRSGLVAGDAALLERFLKYRTYHGCALPNHTQQVSAMAWQDEAHVVANRAAYRDKFETLMPILQPHYPVATPAGGFFCWLPVPDGDDEAFAAALFREQHVTVLPGSYLGRTPRAEEADKGNMGRNGGAGHVRIAWVAPAAECVEAAQRLAQFARSR